MAKENRAEIDQIILVFRGGGYDGCVWEWNCLVFDKQSGKLISSEGTSGYKGRQYTELAKNGFRAVLRQTIKDAYKRLHWFVVHDSNSWSEFCKEFNAGFVRSVAKLVDYDLPCQSCGLFFSADDIYHCGYRGNGGTGVQYDDNTCMECAEEQHDEYCSKDVWRYLKLEEKVKAIQDARNEGSDVNIFSARAIEAPIHYEYYSSPPDLY
jgi:hypothetical protein